MLRGNWPATIDEKGRLKIPSAFLPLILERYGAEVYVTSLTGESVWIYPMPVWTDIERKLGAIPSTLPARRKFFNRVSYYGQPGELDKQGRILIPTRLREAAAMAGEVDVLGLFDHLEVWNHDRQTASMVNDPVTDGDLATLSGYGI